MDTTRDPAFEELGTDFVDMWYNKLMLRWWGGLESGAALEGDLGRCTTCRTCLKRRARALCEALL